MPTVRPRTLIVSVAILLVAWGSVGCSAATRYRVLSFLLDGVPDPSKPQSTAPSSGGSGDGPVTPVAAPAPVYFHKPYQERECTKCHRGNPEQQSKSRSWLGGTVELIKPKRRLCLDCHDRPTGRYIHGPASAGDCAACHEPHSSRTPHLLLVDSVAGLCVGCHNADTFATSKEHEKHGDRSCIECHDPHSADRRYLLRDEEVIRKGRAPAPAPQTPSAPAPAPQTPSAPAPAPQTPSAPAPAPDKAKGKL